MSGTSARLNAALDQFDAFDKSIMDLSLDRIKQALERLGRPQDRLPPVIHVAGTNGKGSTAAFLRAMAEAAGLSVHVSTSPHLVRFNERIRLAGQLIDDERLIDCIDRVVAIMAGDKVTYFEGTIAAALLAFSETPADLLILEVGLGGRFDATNVIDRPAVSVITPVDYDHMDTLGVSSLGEIAFEKAGIIKSNCPVVSAPQSGEAQAVIKQVAASLSAPAHFITTAEVNEVEPPLGLFGDHQRLNAAVAARALSLINDPQITPEAIHRGRVDAVWPGRLQKLEPGPLTEMAAGAELWVDGGHNPHAGRALARAIGDMPGKTALISAMMANKDMKGFFAPFVPLKPVVFTCPNPGGLRAAEASALAWAAEATGLTARAWPSFEAALRAAAATAPARILICGSLYLAGQVLAYNNEIPD